MATIAGTEIKVDQRSPEWVEARLGIATSSRFRDIIAKAKTGRWKAERAKYLSELVSERLTGKPVERYQSKAMEYGTETEDLARVTYSLAADNAVESSGLWKHPTLPIAASPDGLIGADGTLEIKCYELHRHLKTLRAGKLPEEHYPQIQGQLWLTGRTWCHFVSYAPEVPQNAQLLIVEVPRDEAYIIQLEQMITDFLREVDDEVAFIKGYKLILPPEKRPIVEATPKAKKVLTAAPA